MNETVDPIAELQGFAETVAGWLMQDFLTLATLIQSGWTLIALALGHAAAARLCRGLATVRERGGAYARVAGFAEPLYRPVIALTLIWAASATAERLGLQSYLLEIAASLLLAWIVIRMAVNVIQSRPLGRMVALAAWSVAALDIVGLLDPLLAALDGTELSIGSVSVSILEMINGVAVFSLLVWIALLISRLVENRVEHLPDLSPSGRELFKKLARISLLGMGILVALNATGIDLTTLAIFSGGLGVGIGFGLQKVVANFVSGVILLVDRSIKPGDVIETQGTFGWINHLGARYTSIITRDGTEFLIPNEDMITQPVINWSFSDRRVRRKLPVTVSYDCDPRAAMALMEEGANAVDRVLSNPAPVARLMAFGDNGIELELRVWIEDPQAGVVNVGSEILLQIWDRFREAGIEIPYPQRSLRFPERRGDAAVEPDDGRFDD